MEECEWKQVQLQCPNKDTELLSVRSRGIYKSGLRYGVLDLVLAEKVYHRNMILTSSNTTTSPLVKVRPVRK